MAGARDEGAHRKVQMWRSALEGGDNRGERNGWICGRYRYGRLVGGFGPEYGDGNFSLTRRLEVEDLRR